MKFENECKRVNTTTRTSSQPLFTTFRLSPVFNGYKYTQDKEDIGSLEEGDSNNPTTTSASSVAQQQNESDDLDNIFIKVETPEKYRKLSHVELIDEEYYHYCNLCNSKMPSLESVLDHFEAAHDMNQFRSSSFKHIEVEPDHLIFTHHIMFKPTQQTLHSSNVNDMNNDQTLRCPLCKTSHESKQTYDQHLTQHHNVNLSRISMTSNINALPDWNSSDLYCPSCNATFNTKKAFKFHCRNIHCMKSPGKFPNKGQPDINDPEHHCRVCSVTFKSRKVYRHHCRYAHDVELRKTFAHPDLTPDVSNPDHYCQTCDRFYSSKSSYRKHLLHVHHMSLQSSNANVEPDVNDPNFYCRSCDKTMRSKYGFKRHLSLIHSLNKRGVRRSARHKNKPDVNDPNHYYRVCKKTYASKYSYRSHVRNQHGIKLRQKQDQVLLPDPLDPDFYCRVSSWIILLQTQMLTLT
ncbi:C2H2-type zinc finger transcription factor [Mucor lusitanicus CBS 277.49]|uniref:C2H2-type zinc finger transcription factor n=1 Tax=Mucor lusitanicus CBS 277.49 TaxID=747725 RepID=A0A168M011_MUCCL|nr:C2H2-type zinc finger transcription factor [Mucor lusitanicus CBS 277.49]